MTFHARGALGPTSPLFRGRTEELARLVQLCQGEVTAYVIVYGGRQTGKTSLLLRLEHQLQETVRVCRVDFQGLPRATAPRMYTFLAQRIASVLPLTPTANVTDPPSLMQFLIQALGTPNVAHLVVLLDELGALPDITREELGNVLRAMFHARLNTPALAKLQIVLTGSIELHHLVVTEVSTLHNICEEIYLGDLDEADAVALIADGLAAAGIDWQTGIQVGQAVYAWVQGHPYLTQRLGSLLDLAVRQGAPLTSATVHQAVQLVLQSDPLLGHLRRSLHEQGLEVATQRLLTAPPRFSRFDEELARLELLGLTKEVNGQWGIRNPLIAMVVREWLNLEPESPLRVPPLPADQPASRPPTLAVVTEGRSGQLVRLREILVTRFNSEELRTLCFDLEIDDDNLGGEGKAGKARELVAFLQRHGRIADLLALGQQLRPDINWGDLPEAPPVVAEPTVRAKLVSTPSPSAPSPQTQPAPPPTASGPEGRKPAGSDGLYADEREATPARNAANDRITAPVIQPTPPNPERDSQQAVDPATSTPGRPRRNRPMLVALVTLVAIAILAVQGWSLFEGMAMVPTPLPAPEPGTVVVPIGTTGQVLELIEIPAGPFLMGSHVGDPVADEREKPQHELTLDCYWIGKTEVTNAQFRPFVEGDGYRNVTYWIEAGWQWRTDEDIRQPRWWDDPQWNGDAQPVVGISWYEAVAYARWVSEQTGHPFRLPTEAEWEKAARGPDGRIWPWGNEWIAGRANSAEAGMNKTTPMGSYPEGASPYGLLDLAGNAWEWTATQWRKDYPYTLEDEWTEAYLAGANPRVLRGGSWDSSEPKFIRGAYRLNNYYLPRDRFTNNGLRLASHSLPEQDAES